MKPSTMRVLSRLLDGRPWVTNGELLQPTCGGNRFGARLAELRKAGIEVLCERLGEGKTRYAIPIYDLFYAGTLLAAAEDRRSHRANKE